MSTKPSYKLNSRRLHQPSETVSSSSGAAPPRALEDTMGINAIMCAVLTCLPTSPCSTARAPLSAASTSSGGEDRISRLPDALLSNIISRLPAKDAARTAALSTRWRRRWASTPLVLDDADLIDLPDDNGLQRRLPVDFDWCAIPSTVGRIFDSHPGPFRRIHLTCYYVGNHGGTLRRWLRLLVAKRVQDLVFVNRPYPLDVPLPADLLRIASLRRLYLGVWRFPDTAGLPPGPDVFPHLRELGLCHTIIKAAEIDHVLQCSPVLETLSILVSYYSPARVRVRSRSLLCMVFWMSLADELAVVVAPRLERLIIWQTCPCVPDGVLPTKVKIGYATELRVLGYLEPSIHTLEIGNTVIEAGTKMTPGKMVPSVKILALKVRFGIRKDVRTLPTFLRCFPNVETLHVMSDEAEEPTGKLNFKFWQETDPIECLHSRIKKVVFDKFRGERSELVFLKFVLERARALQKIVVVLANGDPASVDEMRTKLTPLATARRVSEYPTLLIVAREGDSAWCFHRASDLSVSDPFDYC